MKQKEKETEKETETEKEKQNSPPQRVRETGERKQQAQRS